MASVTWDKRRTRKKKTESREAEVSRAVLDSRGFTDTDWHEKIEVAKEARRVSKRVRKGKRAAFGSSMFTPQWDSKA